MSYTRLLKPLYGAAHGAMGNYKKSWRKSARCCLSLLSVGQVKYEVSSFKLQINLNKIQCQSGHYQDQ